MVSTLAKTKVSTGQINAQKAWYQDLAYKKKKKRKEKKEKVVCPLSFLYLFLISIVFYIRAKVMSSSHESIIVREELLGGPQFDSLQPL